MKTLIEKSYGWLITIGNALRSPVLLIIRLYWGWEFFLTGEGKLMDLSKPTQYFESLGIPLPHVSATLAACTEMTGGLLLLVGLASRLISIPLMILLVTAYLTADSDAVHAIFGDPDKFLNATEFQFLFVVVIVFVCRPGIFSFDALVGKFFKRDRQRAAGTSSEPT